MRSTSRGPRPTDLWVSLLLEVSDNALAKEVGSSNDVKDLFVVVSHEGQLETEFSRVDRNRAWTG